MTGNLDNEATEISATDQPSTQDAVTQDAVTQDGLDQPEASQDAALPAPAFEDLPADFWQDYHEQSVPPAVAEPEGSELGFSDTEALPYEALDTTQASPSNLVTEDFGPLFATLQDLFPGSISRFEPHVSEAVTDAADVEAVEPAAIDSDEE